MKNNLLIKISDVNMVYTNPQGQQFNALKNISIEINEGDYVAILGTSGSGKTTLSNVIGMLNSKYTGEYYFEGKPMHTLPEPKLVPIRGEKFGFIFQDYVLLDFLSALDNVALALQYHDIPKKKIKEMAKEKLISVGLGEKLHHKPYQLSGGQKQRVSIARALVKNPRVIIADEPTGALDHNSRSEILALLQELNQQGVTIITVTHSNEDAQAARRIIQVEKGEIAHDRLQRNRIRYFGKTLNIDNPVETQNRKSLVMDHVNLHYGINDVDSFLDFAENECDIETKLKLLNQIKSCWLERKEVQTVLEEWFEEDDQLIKLMISFLVLNGRSDQKDMTNLWNKTTSFFSESWEEETCMFFFQNLKNLPKPQLVEIIKFNYFFEHPSSKVRATAIQFFKNSDLNLKSEMDQYIDIILTDKDPRVRSNMLDYIYTLKGFEFKKLRKYALEKDSSSRVKAIWAEMLFATKNNDEAMAILEPMVFSQDTSHILAAVWVLAKNSDFNIAEFLDSKIEKNPTLLCNIDEILKTYARVKRDLMNWRIDQDDLVEAKNAA